MSITKPPVLTAWADAGDKVQPSAAELSVGWPLSTTPPSRQRFNWVLNYVMNAVRYFSRRGMPDYDATETYMIGDRVIGDDGKTYKCIADNTTALAPSSNSAKWTRWGFTLAELFAENGAYKDYVVSGDLAPASYYLASGSMSITSGQVLASAQTTITNPSATRSMLISLRILGIRLSAGAVTQSNSNNMIGQVVRADGTTLACFGYAPSVSGTSSFDISGLIEGGCTPFVLAPGASETVTLKYIAQTGGTLGLQTGITFATAASFLGITI